MLSLDAELPPALDSFARLRKDATAFRDDWPVESAGPYRSSKSADAIATEVAQRARRKPARQIN